MSRTYVFRRPVAFGDVDYARILYYPKFFHYCHQALEGFAADALGISYAELLGKEKIGFPTVHIEADYHAPIPYGSDIEIATTLVKLGTKSLVVRFRARVPGDPGDRMEARITKVCVDMDAFTGQPIPAWIVERFRAYLETPS